MEVNIVITGYLGLGSNVGNREENIFKAIKLITERYSVLDVSSIYNTEPVGYLSQGDFLNMVIKIDTENDDPFKILSLVKSIEKRIGRKDTFKWGPRVIDIDILYIDGIFLRTETLNIPHLFLFNRDFVLIPLLEIARSLEINGKLFDIQEYISHNMRVEVYKTKKEINLNKLY